MAQLIKQNGQELEVKPQNGKFFTLEELQGYVHGYIQIVYLKDGRLMVVNEEGKFNEDFCQNMKATRLFVYDEIVGDVLVCNKNEID